MKRKTLRNPRPPSARSSKTPENRRQGGLGAWRDAAGAARGIQLFWGHFCGGVAAGVQSRGRPVWEPGVRPGVEAARPMPCAQASRSHRADARAPPAPRGRHGNGRRVPDSNAAQPPGPREAHGSAASPGLRWRAGATRPRPRSAGRSSRASSRLLNNSGSAPGDPRGPQRPPHPHPPGPFRCPPLPASLSRACPPALPCFDFLLYSRKRRARFHGARVPEFKSCRPHYRARELGKLLKNSDSVTTWGSSHDGDGQCPLHIK